jgi:alpha-galactosidase
MHFLRCQSDWLPIFARTSGFSILMALLFPAFAAANSLEPAGKWTANSRGNAPTPPMGWNSWNAFRTEVNEDKVIGAAEALVSTGLARLGYVYVNIDDGWWLKRRAIDQKVQIRTAIFPSARIAGSDDTSFRPFTDKLHALGLKAGIYSDIGRNACSQAYELSSPNLPEGTQAEREVGLYGHVDGDIRTYFQDWGFDYIKVDACGISDYAADRTHVKSLGYRVFNPIMFRDLPARDDITQIRGLYQQVADALQRYRPDNRYVLSICAWGHGDVRAWGKKVGNSWRTTDDIYPSWTRMLNSFDGSATRALYAHPGAWNDPDMLFIGAGDFDENHVTEAQTHFTLWAMLNAPLLIGYDLRAAPQVLLNVWGNADLVAINQDAAGNQAVLAYRSDDVDILVKTLNDGTKAVALFNRGLKPFDIVLTADHLKFDARAPITLHDLWTKTTLPKFVGEITMKVAPRETKVFVASGTRRLPNGIYLSEMPGGLNVAEDGVRQAEPDPELHRDSGETGNNGSWPVYTGWGGAQADASPYSTALSIGADRYRTGIGVLANSRIEVRAGGAYGKLTAKVGVDNSTRNRVSPVVFSIYGDGRLLARSRPMKFGIGADSLTADVSGVKTVELVVRQATDASNPAAVSWAEAAMTR